ncbi:hypothetical protein ACHAXS_013132 [Conticribra weissflogii]
MPSATTKLAVAAAMVSNVLLPATAFLSCHPRDVLYSMASTPLMESRHLQIPLQFATHDNDDFDLGVIANIIQTDVIQRRGLTEQFERWKFLQQVLEGEIHSADIEDVMLVVLTGYLEHGPTAITSTKDNNGGSASPILNEVRRQMILRLIGNLVSWDVGSDDDGENDGGSRILHKLIGPPIDYESEPIDDVDPDAFEGGEMDAIDPKALSILEQIEQLLPDPAVDEESHKGAWDLVIDLFGRESVRIREEKLRRNGNGVAADGKITCKESLEWRTTCSVTRVLIYYDFLTKGVLKEGAFM